MIPPPKQDNTPLLRSFSTTYSKVSDGGASVVLIFKADDANLLIKPVSCLTRNVALGPTKAVPAVADNNRKAAVANFIFNGYGRH